VSATVYGLFTAKKGYPFFMGVDTSVSVAPKWGSFTVGTLMLDAKAVSDWSRTAHSHQYVTLALA
jgi:hypothetical protein